MVVPNYISLDEYKKNGGYNIVNQIRIGEITNKQIIETLKDSGLKGKGRSRFSNRNEMGNCF